MNKEDEKILSICISLVWFTAHLAFVLIFLNVVYSFMAIGEYSAGMLALIVALWMSFRVEKALGNIERGRKKHDNRSRRRK